jgi:D-glycero-D-manno-heptose 1,7-bisphosphate phosphatase
VLSWRRAGRTAPPRAVFVDRDGVLNRWIPGGYVLTRDDLVVNDGVVDALRAVDRDAFALVVASNQSCVGRGLLTAAALRDLMDHLVAQLDARGLALDAWYCCPHAPADGCACRKPAPGLLAAAAAELGIELPQSYFIGDQPTDMEAAARAGVHGLAVRPDSAADVRAAVRAIGTELRRAG